MFRNGRGVELRIDGAPVLEQAGPRTTQVEGLSLDATATDGELQLTAMEAVQEGTLQLSQIARRPDEEWAVIHGTLHEDLAELKEHHAHGRQPRGAVRGERVRSGDLGAAHGRALSTGPWWVTRPRSGTRP